MSRLELQPGDREELESWASGATTNPRLTRYARVLLLAADGETNRTIGQTVGYHYNRVSVIRQQYERFGLADIRARAIEQSDLGRQI